MAFATTLRPVMAIYRRPYNASVNDLIIVQPGVYASFTVSGSSHDNLTIRGMDPDTVLVDASGGGYAVRIQDADGVRLEKMTLRNTSYGVQLINAGIGGHKDNQLAERTILDHLLIYDTTTHNIYLDRSSTVTVSNSTLVRAGNHVGVDMSGPFDATVDAGWQAKRTRQTPSTMAVDSPPLTILFSTARAAAAGAQMETCRWRAGLHLAPA